MKWNLNTKKFTFAGKGLTCGVQVGTKSPQGLLLFLMAVVGIHPDQPLHRLKRLEIKMVAVSELMSLSVVSFCSHILSLFAAYSVSDTC